VYSAFPISMFCAHLFAFLDHSPPLSCSSFTCYIMVVNHSHIISSQW
jgi:hypothetical protein